jgi:hypothetical protein
MRAAQVVHNAYMDRYPVLLNVVTQLQLVNGTASITTAEVRRCTLCAARAVRAPTARPVYNVESGSMQHATYGVRHSARRGGNITS